MIYFVQKQRKKTQQEPFTPLRYDFPKSNSSSLLSEMNH